MSGLIFIKFFIMLFFSLFKQITSIQSLSLISFPDRTWILNPFTKQFNPSFQIETPLEKLSCQMPNTYIYNQSSHNTSSLQVHQYSLQSTDIKILSVQGKYWDIKSNISCVGSQCIAIVDNLCDDQSQQTGRILNRIYVHTSKPQYDFQYLVNCHPQKFYKPFQWGLFILIFIGTVTITLSSFYSRAWSYGGFGISIGYKFIIFFNFLLVIGSLIAYYLPMATSISLKIVGTIIGIIGVSISISQALWLFRSPKLNKQILFNKIRCLDIISILIGLIVMILYWVTRGWIFNDILAICTIVASIKIFKIRSLKVGVFMLFTLLLIQTVGGLIVHYVMNRSYNNLVIQLFQSPLVVVFPSITPQIYRKCAWIPVTNLIFPGLFISYLRRFDKSRGTFLYIGIGYISFYIGSILWMIFDMMTPHALPIAIISDPIVTLTVIFFANRRNQLQTIWTGMFFDTELPDFSQDLILPDRYSNFGDQSHNKSKQGGRYTIGLQQMTDDLKIRESESSQI